jgi:hypothetical protein
MRVTVLYMRDWGQPKISKHNTDQAMNIELNAHILQVNFFLTQIKPEGRLWQDTF